MARGRTLARDAHLAGLGPVAMTVIVGAVALFACDDGPTDSSEPTPVLSALSFASPVLPGTTLTPEGTGLGTFGAQASLELTGEGAAALLPRAGGSTLGFSFTDTALQDLGSGERIFEARIVEGNRASTGLAVTLDVRAFVPPVLTDSLTLTAFRNEEVVIRGDGFLSEGEGVQVLRFEGEFEGEGEEPAQVSEVLPVRPAEVGRRDRGLVRLTSILGGIGPGVFRGTVTLESTFLLAEPLTSESVAAAVTISPPAIFKVAPVDVSLGQSVVVTGGGFVGGTGGALESTSLELTGTFAPDGESPAEFGPEEVVLRFVSGAEARLDLEPTVVGAALVSSLFGSTRGTFTGTARPIVASSTERFEGEAAAVTLVLGPVRQVVWMRFLPGFYDSLAAFGLTASTGLIEGRIADRVEELYAGWPMDVRLDEPADFTENGYCVVEVGGPDPNGLGLFGYDNTPGKDVGNVRLFDRIGGANASTQADGYPGYGGVFIESLFVFSSHPPVNIVDRTGAEADPLFDEIFDGVRAKPASLAEVGGEGAAPRNAAVARAITTLANVVGETTAHELGHSLGLANPFGAPTAYHDDGDFPGCIMENGSARPFGERAGEEGFADPVFCYDAPGYLDAVFAVD